jgi:hypothetical protein
MAGRTVTVGLAAGAAFASLAACVPVPDGQWFTPSGVPLGEIDCISPAPLASPSGREICKARLIGETPKEMAHCKAQGGTVGPVSVVDGRFACSYRKAAPDADGGSDTDGRANKQAGTKA